MLKGLGGGVGGVVALVPFFFRAITSLHPSHLFDSHGRTTRQPSLPYYLCSYQYSCVYIDGPMRLCITRHWRRNGGWYPLHLCVPRHVTRRWFPAACTAVKQRSACAAGPSCGYRGPWASCPCTCCTCCGGSSGARWTCCRRCVATRTAAAFSTRLHWRCVCPPCHTPDRVVPLTNAAPYEHVVRGTGALCTAHTHKNT